MDLRRLTHRPVPVSVQTCAVGYTDLYHAPHGCVSVACVTDKHLILNLLHNNSRPVSERGLDSNKLIIKIIIVTPLCPAGWQLSI